MLCLTEQPAQRISIHAPPRGATVSVREASDMVIFQFPPLREGRPGINTPDDITKLFQFPPLREGRLVSWLVYSATLYFNSRPSARGDSKRYAISANLLSNPHKLPCFSSRAM